MNLSDRAIAWIRTTVPGAVGYAGAWAAERWHVPGLGPIAVELGPAAGLTLATVFYTGVRWGETRWPRLGYLLGIPAQPAYAATAAGVGRLDPNSRPELALPQAGIRVASGDIGRRYGLVRQGQDGRDYRFARRSTGPLPPAFAQQGWPGPYDQGQLGSCTGNGVAGIVHYEQIRQQRRSVWPPSRLFIYFFERMLEGTVAEDAGANIRDGIKVVAQRGVPAETAWPYVVSQFARRPSRAALRAAKACKAVRYEAVPQTLDAIRSAVADGFGVVFGMDVYSSFESSTVALSGAVPMPQPGEQLLGGHCMVITGYDDRSQRFTVRNSWGGGWGAGGCCTIPYAYLIDPQHASDFWVIELTS